MIKMEQVSSVLPGILKNKQTTFLYYFFSSSVWTYRRFLCHIFDATVQKSPFATKHLGPPGPQVLPDLVHQGLKNNKTEETICIFNVLAGECLFEPYSILKWFYKTPKKLEFVRVSIAMMETLRMHEIVVYHVFTWNITPRSQQHFLFVLSLILYIALQFFRIICYGLFYVIFLCHITKTIPK